jgi:hypothetical protein
MDTSKIVEMASNANNAVMVTTTYSAGPGERNFHLNAAGGAYTLTLRPASDFAPGTLFFFDMVVAGGAVTVAGAGTKAYSSAQIDALNDTVVLMSTGKMYVEAGKSVA